MAVSVMVRGLLIAGVVALSACGSAPTKSGNDFDYWMQVRSKRGLSRDDLIIDYRGGLSEKQRAAFARDNGLIRLEFLREDSVYGSPYHADTSCLYELDRAVHGPDLAAQVLSYRLRAQHPDIVKFAEAAYYGYISTGGKPAREMGSSSYGWFHFYFVSIERFTVVVNQGRITASTADSFAAAHDLARRPEYDVRAPDFGLYWVYELDRSAWPADTLAVHVAHDVAREIRGTGDHVFAFADESTRNPRIVTLDFDKHRATVLHR